jgi:ABC-2 type transport system ATP-binding protein
MTAITADGLTRKFGDLTAVDDMTFHIASGGVVGFVGPNGSGKSTTIRVLLGLIKATSGTGTVLGEPIEHPERFAHRVGALIENPTFIGSLSARDNLRNLAALTGIPGKRIDEVLETVGLTGRENDKATTFSLGMKQRLGIAAALLPDPELLVLDEPTNGLDPADVGRLIEAVKSKGWTYTSTGHEVSVDIPASDAAELDRVAHEAGLTLRLLAPRQDDLEDVFLKMTGSTDAELAVGRSGQRNGEEQP